MPPIIISSKNLKKIPHDFFKDTLFKDYMDGFKLIKNIQANSRFYSFCGFH